MNFDVSELGTYLHYNISKVENPGSRKKLPGIYATRMCTYFMQKLFLRPALIPLIMNKKAIVIASVIACSSLCCINDSHESDSHKEVPSHSSELSAEKLNHDSVSFVKDFNNEMTGKGKIPINIDYLIDNFFNSPNKKSLTLILYIIKSKDETYSENIGNLTYKMLKHETDAFRDLMTKVHYLSPEYRDLLSRRLAELICIDLHYESYSYERCMSDFPIIATDSVFRKEIDKCYSEWVE